MPRASTVLFVLLLVVPLSFLATGEPGAGLGLLVALIGVFGLYRMASAQRRGRRAREHQALVDAVRDSRA